jgi:cytochrome c553
VKNIIVGLLTVVIVGLMAYTASVGRAYHGGEAGHVIEDMGTKQAAASTQNVPKAKDDRAIEEDKLKALRDKAGNIGKFKVSHEYKSKCASCHGINGEGIIGSKLIGLEADVVYQKLLDYKSGRKENLVMKGLLIKLTPEDLRIFADEIGEFAQRAATQQE